MAVKVKPWKQKPRCFVVSVSVTLPGGKPYRKRKRLCDVTSTQARHWGDQHLALVMTGGPAAVALPPPAPKPKVVPTMEAFLEDYLSHCEAERQKPSTIVQKRSLFRAHLGKVMGKVRLDQVGQPELAALKVKMKALDAQTVNNALTMVNTMLQVAADLGHIDQPRLRLGLLRKVSKEMAFYDFGDLDRLIEAARKISTEAVAMVLLGAHAGLRRGEILALRWCDVDQPNERLNIMQAVWCSRIGLPKGNRTRRVPLTGLLAQALKDHRHLRGQYVLAGEGPAPMAVRTIQELMRVVQRRASMDATARFHVLRHTFCSHLAMRGATITAIKELAGHAQIATTMKYAHLSPATVRAAVHLLDGPGIAGNGLATTLGPEEKGSKNNTLGC